MDTNLLLIILGSALTLAIGGVIYLYFSIGTKEDIILQMQEAHVKLMRSFNDLDEQAKLIVKTDLELNKAQEELDKRLNGLNALQRTSRNISQALNETEIFQKLNPTLFEELGFTRALVATLDEKGFLRMRTNISYSDDRIQSIFGDLLRDEQTKNFLKETRALSSASSARKLKDRITQIVEAEFFVLAPIMSQTGTLGFVFVGNRANAMPVTQGDEELIIILASQIGQAIENAQLFEKVFRSSQELEIKVKDRTRQLASALTKVEEISKKKTEFISAVSHELRTPLTSIKGYASLLIAGKMGEIADGVKERLIKINTHSDNLVGLINNLLDIARIESGKQEMKYAIQNTKHVFENVADLLTPQLTAKEIKIVLQAPTEVPEIYIDMVQAERVFINLLSNAIKFTPKDGTITIAGAPVVEKGYATFSVTDTGIGIPEDDLKKLFSEFFRVDNEINQHVKGTGLGLVLAKNIVQAHGGRIWVTSKVGVGTTFAFTLPVSEKAFEDNRTDKIV